MFRLRYKSPLPVLGKFLYCSSPLLWVISAPHMHTQAHTQAHMHAHTCRHTHAHTCTHRHTHRHTCMHTQAGTHMHTHAHTDTYMQVHTIRHTGTCTHAHTCRHTGTCTRVHTQAGTHMHTHTIRHTLAHISVHTHADTQEHAHTCRHRHTHEHAHTCRHAGICRHRRHHAPHLVEPLVLCYARPFDSPALWLQQESESESDVHFVCVVLLFNLNFILECSWASQVALLVKKPTSRCGRCRFHLRVRKIPCRRGWHPSPGFLPGESHGQRSLVGHSPWGLKESDTTEVTQHTHSWFMMLC